MKLNHIHNTTHTAILDGIAQLIRDTTHLEVNYHHRYNSCADPTTLCVGYKGDTEGGYSYIALIKLNNGNIIITYNQGHIYGYNTPPPIELTNPNCLDTILAHFSPSTLSHFSQFQAHLRDPYWCANRQAHGKLRP